MVGTEYADWNDSRPKIKLGQEGGGFQEPCLVLMTSVSSPGLHMMEGKVL